MTFKSIPITEITVHREDRQRRILNGIDDLADSINRLGLINPITIDDNNILIAGERRFEACRKLGWTHITAQLFSDLSPLEQHLIEYDENCKRHNLTWQEQARAIDKTHKLATAENPKWTQEQTAKKHNLERPTVSKYLTVARELSNESVASSATLNTAFVKANEVARKRDDIHTRSPGTYTHESPILTGDFLQWAAQQQPLFNFIHCDFPYGINYQDAPGQNAANTDRYLDTPETYWQLFKALATNLDNFCAPDAHMIFWFSPNLYCPTWEMLKLLDGFTFEEHPLIWQRGLNEGIAPDPNRRPRRIYDMAFFGWRGQARINVTKANCFEAPTEREGHPSEKSQTALEHFFSMFVDEHTHLIDPTCGSGSSLRAARALGASRTFGIEQNEEFAETARRSLAASSGDDLPE